MENLDTIDSSLEPVSKELKTKNVIISPLTLVVMSEVDQLEAKVAQLEILKQRIHTRLSTLRKSQVAIMIERNLYLSKLRKVENYGRDHDWGKKVSNTDTNTSDEVPNDGQILLHSIYDVLYAASKNTSL